MNTNSSMNVLVNYYVIFFNLIIKKMAPSATDVIEPPFMGKIKFALLIINGGLLTLIFILFIACIVSSHTLKNTLEEVGYIYDIHHKKSKDEDSTGNEEDSSTGTEGDASTGTEEGASDTTNTK